MRAEGVKMTVEAYEHIPTAGAPIKAWVKGVGVDGRARQQLENVAGLPFIHEHVAAMPDCHWGLGATIGSVIPTRGAIIPAAVGVDIGCGMMAVRLNLTSHDLPDNAHGIRTAIEKAVPHGRTDNGGKNDRGAWSELPNRHAKRWAGLVSRYEKIIDKHPKAKPYNTGRHMGTLGTGNHFIELCLDEDDRIWIMLHSGSRGPGNRFGTYFIELAKKDMERWFISLPNKDLAYLAEGSDHFYDYIKAVSWAQNYAKENREAMMEAVFAALERELPGGLYADEEAVNCHHNYVARENHYDANIWVTRKGAIRARSGDLGIIPGSMGAKSFIVRGKGNPESFHSCSHGAGRKMSRGAAKKTFTLDDHAKATEGVECRKDKGVLDETPGAYKDIDAVMAAQEDLVDVVHTLKQIVCVKG